MPLSCLKLDEAEQLPKAPDVSEELLEHSLLVAVRALVLSRCATQGVHEAAREITGGREREERVGTVGVVRLYEDGEYPLRKSVMTKRTRRDRVPFTVEA